MLVVAERKTQLHARDIVYTAPGGYNIATSSINVKFSGKISNGVGANAPLNVTVKLLAKSSGGPLASPVASQSITVNPGSAVDVSLNQLVRDTDPAGTLTASVWLEQSGVVVPGSQINSNTLATISTPPALGLTGGFASERQVRYVGGIETPTPRSAFIVLTAYVSPLDGSSSLTKLREVRSGDFQIPVVQVPNIVVPVSNSDPAGLLAGGLKVFDAASGALLTTNYGPERIQNGLWALNAGLVALWPAGATPTGQAQNYFGSVAYRINNLILANTGDTAMTVRVRSWMSAIQSLTNMNFGEIPGFTFQWDLTIAAGGSIALSIARGPAEVPQPYYDWIAYGNYVRLDFALTAVSGGFASYFRSWDVGQNTGIFF